MKSYLISDNVDTLVGMAIVGIKGEVIHDRNEVIRKLNELKKNPQIYMILLTEKISALIPNEVRELKLSKKG
ncbi:MAG: V-type ATP synthase subunit F, partial [Oscillospiraceae bacterium]|nr:V-type ATP synthase subunit F [Oscillospiraceae bacterium]